MDKFKAQFVSSPRLQPTFPSFCFWSFQLEEVASNLSTAQARVNLSVFAPCGVAMRVGSQRNGPKALVFFVFFAFFTCYSPAANLKIMKSNQVESGKSKYFNQKIAMSLTETGKLVGIKKE